MISTNILHIVLQLKWKNIFFLALFNGVILHLFEREL